MASLSQLSARLVDLFGSPTTANPTKLLGNLGVSPAGNVLVGTSTDNGTDKLQVSGSTNFGGLVTINGAAATNRMTAYTTLGSARWKQGVSVTPESGSNVGSDWFVNRYSDTGASLDTPLLITRSTGMVTAADGITVSGFSADGIAQYRAIYGNYGVMIRNDGASCYLMSTVSGAPTGSYSSLRPFYWNLSTGVVVINGDGSGTTIGGPLTCNSTLSASSLSASGAIVSNGGNATLTGWGGNANAGVLYFGNSNKYLYFNGTGYFLNNGQLNVTSPTYPLQITNTNYGGYWNVGPDGSNSFCIFNQGNTGVWVGTGGTTWNAQSDERLKNVQSEITNAVQDVESLRTVRYTWKNDDDHAEALGVEKDSRVYVGVLAQDVQKVVPEAVGVGPNGYLGVAYSDLIPLALAAIKELSAEVKALKEEVETLKGKQ